jgi:hypothetical protein
MGCSLMRVAPSCALDRSFVVVENGRQLGRSARDGLPSRLALLFRYDSMTNDITDALARIDRALTRIERASTRREPVADGRYQRLRQRTQAALAELDTVIARVARSESN